MLKVILKNKNEFKMSFYKGNYINLFFAYFMSAADATSNIMVAFVMKLLLDVSGVEDMHDFQRVAGVVIVFLLLDLLITYTNRRIYNRFSRKAITQYKNQVFRNILNKNINAFNNETTSKYLSAFSNDLEIIEKNYLKGSVQIFNNLILLVGGFMSMICLNYKLTILVILASSTSWLVSVFVGPKLIPLEKETSAKNESFMNLTKNMLSGFTIIKSFKAESEVYKYFSEMNFSLERTKLSRNLTSDSIAVLSRSASLLTDFIVFTIGVFFVLRGEISLGVIIAFVQLLNYVISPLQKLGPLCSKRKAALSLIEKLQNNLFIEEKAKDSVNHIFNDKIVYRNVSFAYDEAKVLDSVDLVIEKGKSYAIVGNSGSGKSTLINLLLGYTDKYEGDIIIDDMELRECSISNLYDIFSNIQQDVFIFDDTILNNITMYKPFDENNLTVAIQQSGLKELIESKGMNYVCGENGCNLSGGEKQRISIARCLLRKTPVILMDEATSALDKVTSYGIEEELLSLNETTKVVVTHKLEKKLLKLYDNIIVMSNGRIIEQGSFEDLISQGRYFASLYNIVNEMDEK